MRKSTGILTAAALTAGTLGAFNRDRSCPGAYPNDDTCSGVSQQAWDFTRILAQYTG